ncbi:TetR/AcrR family transcriptional regulator [Pseudonocardia xinjiangensis]|uniref:TetR/AcrR family transcriptional regulator n=1 Tax=Pseudonocardia xinjiangensis TaxID=75289 RepID=UPI003D8D6044
METEQRRPTGRPRGFDVDEALERALRVFWEQGYEGASLSTLTGAMGISTTSMYSTFGNKEELFRKALDRYSEGPSAYLHRALDEPTALGVASAILAGTILTTTRPDNPHGCLGVQGALATSDSGRQVRDLLAAWRDDTCTLVRDRFARAVDDGDLPPEVDPGLLARLVTTVAYGIAVQAASGVDQEELRAIADAILRQWPLL